MNQTTPKTKTKPSTREETSKGSFKERYAECIKNLKIVPTVSIKGKAYSRVAERHRHLKKYFPESKIDEALLFHDTASARSKVLLDSQDHHLPRPRQIVFLSPSYRHIYLWPVAYAQQTYPAQSPGHPASRLIEIPYLSCSRLRGNIHAQSML